MMNRLNLNRILSNFILIILNEILGIFRRAPQKIKKIVIYLKGGFGDFTFLIPVLYTLKISERSYIIHLVVSKNLFNIVNRYNDSYKLCDQLRIIGSNSESIVYRFRTFIDEVKYNIKQNYDLFFNPWPSTSLMINVISLFAITKNRIDIENKKSKSIYNYPIYSNAEENVIGLNAKVLDYLGMPLISKTLKIPINESEIHSANQKILKYFGKDLNEIKPFIVLYPHTKKNNNIKKYWKLENYISFINILVKDIKQIKILIMGSTDDLDFCQKIISGIYDVSNVSLLTGKTSIYEDCFITSKCDLFIGIDGGFTHLVNTLSKPSIILWGPTSEILYGVQNSYTINVSSDIEYLRNDRLKSLQKNEEESSTDRISPSFIVELVKKILVSN